MLVSRHQVASIGKKPPKKDEEMEEDEPGADSDDTEEEPDKDFGTVEYFTDRVEEDGVLWWGVHWLESLAISENELFRIYVGRAVTKFCTNHNDQIYALGQSKH